MKEIFDEYLDVSQKEMFEIKNILKNKKYSKLEINLRHPYECKII